MEPGTVAAAAGNGGHDRDGGVSWPSVPADSRRYANRNADRDVDEWAAVDRTDADDLTREARVRERS